MRMINVQLLHRSLARVTHTSEVTLQVIDDTHTGSAAAGERDRFLYAVKRFNGFWFFRTYAIQSVWRVRSSAILRCACLPACVFSRLELLGCVPAIFSMSTDCAFVDPHMHLWDFQEHPDVHDRQLLAGVRDRALSLHYSQEIEVTLFVCVC